MPSLATFSKPLSIGHGKDKRSYPPTSLKAPFLPEPLRIDTSDILTSVQSVSSPLDPPNYHTLEDNRPLWHTNHPYNSSDTGFSGGHQYKVERMEERRRLRSLGLLSGTTTPLAEPPTPDAIMTSSKPETKRRTSWQPPMKGKLQKQRNKSRDPESRKSMDSRDTMFVTTDYRPQSGNAPPNYSFSRIMHGAGTPSMGSPNSSPMMSPTHELVYPPRAPFSQAERSSSSLGSGVGIPNTATSGSLGDLVGFYDPNTPGQAFSTAPSSPAALQNYSQPSSQAGSPVTYQRPQYANRNYIDTTPIPQHAGRNISQAPAEVQAQKPTPQIPVTANSVGNSSTHSLGSSTGLRSAERSPIDKPVYKPYEPKYAAKSHITSTTPQSQTINQEAIPFVHLDFGAPQKPYAPLGHHKSSSETRLTTQEAKEYSAIAQATRESHVRFNSPSETSLTSKRPQLTPSRLSYEVRNSPTPDSQNMGPGAPLKSILRKPIEPAVEEQKSEENLRQQTPSMPTSARATPEPARLISRALGSEPVSPITPPLELEAPERGRSTFKRGEESRSNSDMNRRPSVSARKSIDVEAPSAKNFDISKYTQEKFSKQPPAKPSRTYPPVSYKAPTNDHSPSYSPDLSPPIPPVPAIPESAQSSRGLVTPPPIKYDTAVESSSDEESIERPENRKTESKGKSKLSSSITAAETGPVRPRAPSMTEILKDFHKIEPEDVPHAESDGNDWLSQLFRGKKSEFKLPSRPPSRPGSSNSSLASGSPSLASGKFGKRSSHSRNSSKDLSAQEQQIHERAERQRLEVERKLMEAESEPSLTPRSPRFPRPSVSVTASPDLKAGGNDASSLRTSSSSTSVDRLDPVVGGSSNLGKADEIPENALVNRNEKKIDRSRRLSTAEVCQQLGEMTPPHEREAWDDVQNAQTSTSSIPTIPTEQSPAISPPDAASTPISPIPTVAPLNIASKPQVTGRLPLNSVNTVSSPSTSTSSRTKDSFMIDARSSNSSLLSLEAYKTMTKILVVCCTCSRLHDPPQDLYRQMTQGSADFQCPYCVHKIDILDCCSAYTSICNMIEKLH